MWKQNIYVFDFDSTILKEESLDELLKLWLDGDEYKIIEIEKITNMWMNWEIDMRDSLLNRFSLAKVSLNKLNEYKNSIINQITDWIENIVKNIKESWDEVYIVSWWFLDLIVPVAKALNIAENKCFWNTFVFDDDWSIIWFDDSNPLSKSDWKCFVVGEIKKKYPEWQIFMIWDWYTDLVVFEKWYADKFIWFWINKIREKVLSKSEIYIYNIDDFNNILWLSH